LGETEEGERTEDEWAAAMDGAKEGRAREA